MSIEKSINDQFNLNVLCSRLDKTTEAFQYKIISLLTRSCHKVLLPNTLPKEFLDQSKHRTPLKDWFMGWINCQYIPNMPNVDWAECQIYYKCHAALIIIDMTDSDPQSFSQSLAKIKRNLYNEQILCYNILIWNVKKTYLTQFGLEKEYVIIPDRMSEESLSDFLQKQVQQLIIHTAIHFFHLIEKLTSDVHIIPLFNAKEEISKDSAKVKKKKTARSLKLCGDYALILGCWSDAGNYYIRASKQLEEASDYIWLGKAKEGKMACLYLQFIFGEAEQEPIEKIMRRLTKEAREKLEFASLCYKKAKSVQGNEFEVQLFFKRLHLYKDLKAEVEFYELFKHYDEGIKATLQREQTYKAMLQFASFFYELEKYRKAGFYLKQLGDIILADCYDLTLARDIYLACFPLYYMPLPESAYPESFPKQELQRFKAPKQQLGYRIQRIAPAVQLQLIKDVMSLSLKDKPLQARMLSIILHYFITDLTNNAQKQLFGHLVEIGNSLDSSLTLDLTLLPKVLKIIPTPETLKVNQVGGIFIYNPWKGDANQKSIDYNWMEGSFCYVKIHLQNTFAFEIFVEMITLVTEGVKVNSHPISVTLVENQPLQELVLKFKPLETGRLSILGLLVRISNFTHFHPINGKGVAIGLDEERKLNGKLGIRDIPIKERINILKLSFEDEGEILELSRKSHFLVRILVENYNEAAMSIKKVHFTLTFTDNSISELEFSPEITELKSHVLYSVVVYRELAGFEAPQLVHINDLPSILSTDVHKIPNIDSLSKITLKLVYFENDRPEIQIEDSVVKFINMKQGLSLNRIDTYASFSGSTLELNGKRFRNINIDDYFFLSLGITKTVSGKDDKDYRITILRSDSNKILGGETLTSKHENIRVLVKIHRESLIGLSLDTEELPTILYGRWEERDLMGSGYLLLDGLDLSSLVEKIEYSSIKVAMDSNIPLKRNLMQGSTQHFYTLSVRVNYKQKRDRRFYGLVVISDGTDQDNIFVTNKEKRILYKGSKSHIMHFTEGKDEASMSVQVMFIERKTYQAFFFMVDNEDSVIYSYKQPCSIYIT